MDDKPRKPAGLGDTLLGKDPLLEIEALRQERDLVTAILDTADALVVVLDPQGRIVRFNRACERATGYLFSEVSERCFWDLFLIPEEVIPVKAVFAQLQAGRFPNQYQNFWLTKGGDRRLIAWSNTALLDSAGAVTYVIATGIDITERQQAEEALRRAHSELGVRVRVAESLRGMLTVLNSDRPLDEILEHVVFEATRLLGSDTSAIYRSLESGGELAVQTVRNPSASWAIDLGFPPGLCQALQAGNPVVVSDIAASTPDHQTPGTSPAEWIGCLDEQCHAVLAVPLLVGDEAYGCLVLYYSEPRTFSDDEVGLAVAFAEQAVLAIQNARLRQRAGRAAVIEERARLARELHDSVTQSLYSLTLLAEGWRRLAEAGRLQRGQDPLAEVGAIAQQALKEMRLMVYELRPPALEQEGLLGALHQRLAVVEQRAGVEARLVAEDAVELPASVEEGLYRIAIEALNNALKHAAATTVTVWLFTSPGWVELEVVDNGRGFDLGTIVQDRGIGLDSMRERAEKLGGAVTIQSAPGQGTRVKASIALYENSPAKEVF